MKKVSDGFHNEELKLTWIIRLKVSSDVTDIAGASSILTLLISSQNDSFLTYFWKTFKVLKLTRLTVFERESLRKKNIMLSVKRVTVSNVYLLQGVYFINVSIIKIKYQLSWHEIQFFGHCGRFKNICHFFESGDFNLA